MYRDTVLERTCFRVDCKNLKVIDLREKKIPDCVVGLAPEDCVHKVMHCGTCGEQNACARKPAPGQPACMEWFPRCEIGAVKEKTPA